MEFLIKMDGLYYDGRESFTRVRNWAKKIDGEELGEHLRKIQSMDYLYKPTIFVEVVK